MKRLLTFVLLIGVVSLIFKSGDNKIFDNPNILSACLVSSEELPFETKVTQSGEQKYYYFEQNFEELKILDINSLDGVILYFPPNCLKEVAEFYHISYFQGGGIDDYNVYYGYSSCYPKAEIVGGKKQNLQIACNESGLILGFPSILVGF